jgi:hypothetical protein
VARDVIYGTQPVGLAFTATSPGAPQVSLAEVKCIGNSGQ